MQYTTLFVVKKAEKILPFLQIASLVCQAIATCELDTWIKHYWQYLLLHFALQRKRKEYQGEENYFLSGVS